MGGTFLAPPEFPQFTSRAVLWKELLIMCGIAGILSSRSPEPGLIGRMTAALTRRGPDDGGVWLDKDAGIALGHRRLSIVDLSAAGHEPMHSGSGRFVATFNGEIYNHRELRRLLERRAQAPPGGWRGHSDVEVLLQAIEEWGLESALRQAVGMFAFALWDRHDRTLKLVRDRFGEKPLYYGWAGSDFLFASELKSVRCHSQFPAEISRNALRLYASRAYIPAPLSIYRKFFKLPPGCILTISRKSAAEPLDEPVKESVSAVPRLERYWSYKRVVLEGLADPIRDEAHALAELDRALAGAVADQSIADVPIGTFLSGGIDSSTIAAFYQRLSSRPVQSFSIGFEDPAYDESPFARRVARYLGTIHHEQIVTDRDALEAIPLLPAIYCEPFADSSQVPTYLVSRAARSAVTVALTGDGGDELFGGYYRHFYAPTLWRRLSRVPPAIRAVGAPLSRLPPQFWSHAGRFLPNHGKLNAGAKIQKALRISATARNVDDLYASFLDEWAIEGSPVLDSGGAEAEWDLELREDAPDEIRLMYCDAVSYLPDDILCKVDRASMAVSLETRIPFLDHRVAEVAARIPADLKIRNGQGKQILRSLLHRTLPSELFDRPKAGFAIPIGAWLRGPLRSWAEELLDERRLISEGWFDVAAVRRRWRDHLDGRRDSPASLWAVLMFQAWLDQQRVDQALAA